MAYTTNKVKHLYWHMVLATVVVLILVLNSSKTMVKMIVAGSSASQHAPKDARVKRQLRLSSYMTEEIDGGDEERVVHDFDFNLPAQSEKMIGLLEWANSLRQVNSEEYQKAASAKLNELINEDGIERVLSMLVAAKNVPATKDAADSLEKALVRKWIDGKRNVEFLEKLIVGKSDLTEFLASPLLKIWIDLYEQRRNKDPFEPLLFELRKYYSEPALAKHLLNAQENDAVAETAQFLAKCQMVVWERNGYSGDVVFEHLGLKVAGIQMLDNPVWDTWMSYMVMLDGSKRTPKSELALSVLRKHFNDDVLFEWFAAAETVEGKKRAKALEMALQKKPATTQRQRNDGEASATSKRQRNDDGQ